MNEIKITLQFNTFPILKQSLYKLQSLISLYGVKKYKYSFIGLIQAIAIKKNNKGAFKSPLKVAPYPRLGAPCCGTQDKHIQNIHVRPIYHKIT